MIFSAPSASRRILSAILGPSQRHIGKLRSNPMLHQTLFDSLELFWVEGRAFD
jgi:hypothetical protein